MKWLVHGMLWLAAASAFAQAPDGAPGSPASAPAAAIALDARAEAALKEQVAELTRTYLALLDAEKFLDAYNWQAQAAKEAFGIDNWTARKQQEHQRSGERTRLDIWRLTVYPNPADSPAPGNYIAADYDSEFKNLPVVCGYVMWYQNPAGELSVMREEIGFIDADMVAKIPAGDLAGVRQQIGCQ